jgi:SPP1 gp7 family putative phage head morphogenesis protein
MIKVKANQDAIGFVQGKGALASGTLSSLLPEVRMRAFVVAGLTELERVRRVQERVAKIFDGESKWADIRAEIVEEILPETSDDPEALAAAKDKAELLMRTNGYQAYAATRYITQMANIDAMPYLQYRTFGDAGVRDAHAALDGKVFRADDPFWDEHYPPWDHGCRCIVIALPQAAVDEMEKDDADLPEEDRRVLTGEALRDARNGLIRTSKGPTLDLRSPVQKAADTKEELAAYRFRPQDLTISPEALEARYTPELFRLFRGQMEKLNVMTEAGTVNAWAWMTGRKVATAQTPAIAADFAKAGLPAAPKPAAPQPKTADQQPKTDKPAPDDAAVARREKMFAGMTRPLTKKEREYGRMIVWMENGQIRAGAIAGLDKETGAYTVSTSSGIASVQADQARVQKRGGK